MSRKGAQPPPVGPPALTTEVAIARLRDLVVRVEGATAKGSLGQEEAEPIYFALNRTLRDALGENHPDIHRITEVGFDGIIDIDSGEPTLARARASRLKQAMGLLGEVVIDLERKLADAKPPTSTAVGPTALQQVERVISRFHRVASRLRARHDKRATLDVKDEYDVQDLLHALLTQYFKDIRAEEWTPSYAGKAGRMDFLMKPEQLVIEVKMTRDGLGEKEVGDQLIIDIARYRSHQDCKTLVCFVYDPMGRIGNPEGIERDLSTANSGLEVKVFIRPRSS